MAELCYLKSNSNDQYKGQACLYTAEGSLVCNGNGNSVNQILAQKTLVTGYKENAPQGDIDVVEQFQSSKGNKERFKRKR